MSFGRRAHARLLGCVLWCCASGGGAARAVAQDAAPPALDAPPPPPADAVAPPAERAAPLELVVVETGTFGVEPIVGRHVTAQLRASGAALGYALVPPEATEAAVQRLRMPHPPTPADLWRLTYVAEAHRGAFARVWAQSGQYVVELVVASLDGTGPFYGRAAAGAETLRAEVDALVRRTLPPPSTFASTPTPPPGASPAPPVPTAEDQAVGALLAPTVAPAPREDRRPPVGRRFQLALQTEAVIGTSQDTFYNHLFGVRLDYRIARDLLLGVYAAYANLRGKGGRVSNVLFYAQIENRVRPSSRTQVTLPLRLGIGYLPFNGPVVRLAAGVNVPLSERLELGFDLLTPTFWVLPDRTVVSLDIAAELIWRL